MKVLGPRQLELTLSAVPGKSVRPGELLTQIFGVPASAVRSALIRKLRQPPSV
jgi:hypothetical protein